MNIQDICKICGNEVTATFDAVETPDGWAHHSCMETKIDYCEKCGKGQHPEVEWEATATGWEHIDCTEMFNYCLACNGTTSTGCAIICNEKKGNCMFKMTGFYHVKETGIIEFWQLLNEKGTIDLLWDMKPETKTNALMQSEDFDLDAHIKTNYQHEDYDTILTELHDEMIDAITALEFCFTTNQTHIEFNGRSFKNLDCIKSTDVWNPNVYYPVSAGHTFNKFDDFEAYCMNTLCGPTDPGTIGVIITVYAVSEEEDLSTQMLDYTISGAADSNCLRNILQAYAGCGYKNITFTLK
jgi:hypothetical protein